jgi:hypothetical protein
MSVHRVKQNESQSFIHEKDLSQAWEHAPSFSHLPKRKTTVGHSTSSISSF